MPRWIDDTFSYIVNESSQYCFKLNSQYHTQPTIGK